MKRTFFFKIFLGYLLGAITLASFILIISFSSLRNFHINQLSENLRNLAYTVNLSVQPRINGRRYAELDGYIKSLAANIHNRITIVLLDGTVVADSEANPAHMVNHAGRPEIADVIARHRSSGSAIRFSSTVQQTMLYIAVPVMDGTRMVAVTRISVYLRSIDAHLATLNRHILSITAVFILLALLAAWFFARRLTSPVRQLSEAARRVAEGDFSARTYLSRRDELKGLADTFNEMTERIHTLFTALSRQREELGKIVTSLNEGLFVIDANGRISLGNRSFTQIVRIAPVEGRYHWELLRNRTFEELLKKVSASGDSATDELEYEGRILLCSITPLDDKGEHVVVLHDITQIRDLERMKRDFVANVSHELRTPLTAIKGFVETLEEEAGENDTFHRYLSIIRRHADRLIHIVEDLLLLSEIEQRGSALSLADVDLAELLRTTLRIFDEKAAAKGLTLSLNVVAEPLTVRGDTFKLEQVFINLIDNAIKYTEKGGVAITLSGTDTHAAITIADSGIGIPGEHLSRIFERFYVVDKSRSKKVGGTGLGLAIVKHIISLHNGNISIESVPGTGTTAHISIPRI